MAATHRGAAFARTVIAALVLLLAAFAPVAPARAGMQLTEFLEKVKPASLFPGADTFGPLEGAPPAVAAYKDGRRAGYIFLNTDYADGTGYSGKPIEILLAMDLSGVIRGAELVAHHEPIFLVGIPEAKLRHFIKGYIGTNVLKPSLSTVKDGTVVDAISGATVTAMVVDDTIRHAGIAFAQSRSIGVATAMGSVASPMEARRIDLSMKGDEDWQTLLGDGSVRSLKLDVGAVNDAFAKSGNRAAAARPEHGKPDDIFIDLYVGLATAPVIGRSLIGAEAYEQLSKHLKKGQHAVVIAGRGPYSFKGVGYVRGGVFDRIQLIQGDTTIRFRDRNYSRLATIAADGAPHFRDIGLFILPEGAKFDPAEPWRLQLLVQRSIGAIKKAFLSFDLTYHLPDRYLAPVTSRTAPVAGVPTSSRSSPIAGQPVLAGSASQSAADLPMWQRIWRSHPVEIGILLAAIGILTFVFFLQDWLVKWPRLTDGIRLGFLLFSVIWIGGVAHAQLSVVNIFTFVHALLTGFRWETFLVDPLIFILWASVAAALLFWGRGAFCGWLCPFGSLQELLNMIARRLHIPQISVPWWLHERLWPIKYIIFLGLFGTSLYSVGLAERLSEVEPFKTVIVLHFLRAWPFVVFAGLLLVAGLFIERFYCRYLCPLGAALAIPGRLRMFEWLKRYDECGSPCQRCAKECMVQAIHPDGHINPNECLYCLNCQELYFDDHKCPVVIKKREKHERFLALQSESMASSPKPHGQPKPRFVGKAGTEVPVSQTAPNHDR